MNHRLVRALCVVTSTIALCCFTTSVSAETLTRGPYLQNANTTAVTVRWRSDSGANSIVRYGTSVGSLTQSVSDGANVTNHELRLTGLTPNTKYFYSVGSTGTTLASGSDYFFVTAPTTAKPTRVCGR